MTYMINTVKKVLNKGVVEEVEIHLRHSSVVVGDLLVEVVEQEDHKKVNQYNTPSK